MSQNQGFGLIYTPNILRRSRLTKIDDDVFWVTQKRAKNFLITKTFFFASTQLNSTKALLRKNLHFHFVHLRL